MAAANFHLWQPLNYVRMRISRILGAYISELDRKKQIFLKHTLGTRFLSGMAFTICEVCTERERHLQNFQVSLGGRHL